MTPAQKAALRHMSKFKVVGALFTEPPHIIVLGPSGLYFLSPRSDLFRVGTGLR